MNYLSISCLFLIYDYIHCDKSREVRKNEDNDMENVHFCAVKLPAWLNVFTQMLYVNEFL